MSKFIRGRHVEADTKLQRFFVYLVLFNIVAVLLYIFYLRHMSFGSGMVLPGLLILYNLLLCNLVTRRARRRGDVHLIYLVVFTSISACIVLLYYFFL